MEFFIKDSVKTIVFAALILNVSLFCSHKTQLIIMSYIGKH